MGAFSREASTWSIALVHADKLVKKKNFGSETLADGTISRGTWLNDKKHGQFMTQTVDGKKTVESWSDGKRGR